MENNISIESVNNEGVLHAKIAQYSQIILGLFKENEELKKELEGLKEK